MPRFRYTASDAKGNPVSGNIKAGSAEEASARLQAQGLRVESVEALDAGQHGEAVGHAEPVPEKLRRRDFDNLSRHIAELTEAELPLASGLSHLAQELPHGRYRRAITQMVTRLEAGEDLATVIESHGAPADLRALIRAGVRTGRTAEVLWQYVGHVRTVADLSRRTLLALGYPLFLAVSAGAVTLFLLIWVAPDFKKIFLDFGTELPGITLLLMAISDLLVLHGTWVLLTVLLVGGIAWAVVRYGLSDVTRRSGVCAVFIIGPMLRWAALSRFSHLLAVLVEHDVPLPEALELAGDGSADALVREASHVMARAVESGRPLTSMMSVLTEFPTSLVEMLRWEQDQESLAEAMHSVGELFEGRVRRQSSLIAYLCEPAIISTIGSIIGFIVTALFMPLVKLLNDLS